MVRWNNSGGSRGSIVNPIDQASNNGHLEEIKSADTMNQSVPSSTTLKRSESSFLKNFINKNRNPSTGFEQISILYAVIKQIDTAPENSTAFYRHNMGKKWLLKPGYIGRAYPRKKPPRSMIIPIQDSMLEEKHVKISVHDQQIVLQDNNSATGTFLVLTPPENGVFCRNGHRLLTGDVFELGKDIRFYVELVEVALKVKSRNDHKDRSAETGISSPNTKAKKVTFKIDEISSCDRDDLNKNMYYATKDPYEVESHRIRLSYFKDGAKQEYEFSKCGISLGSCSFNDIVICGESEIQPIHCRINFDGDTYAITDLSSSLIFGTRILLNHPLTVVNGDKIMLGGTFLDMLAVNDIEEWKHFKVTELAIRVKTYQKKVMKSMRRDKFSYTFLPIPLNQEVTCGYSRSCNIRINDMKMKLRHFNLLATDDLVIMPNYSSIDKGIFLLLGRNDLLYFPTQLMSEKRHMTQMSGHRLNLTTGTFFKCGNSEFHVNRIKLAETYSEVNSQREYSSFLSSSLTFLHHLRFVKKIIDAFSLYATTQKFEKGCQIINSGDFSTGLYIVLSGTVKIESLNFSTDQNREFCEDFYLLLRGSFFGETCLLDGTHTEMYSAFALDDVACLYISSTDVKEFWFFFWDAIMPGIQNMTDQSILNQLLSVELFKDFNFRRIRRIANLCQIVTFQPNTLLITDKYSKGNIFFYIILEGDVIVTKCEDGANESKQLYTSPMYFQKEKAIYDDCFIRTACAQNFVQCIAISVSDFSAVVSPLLCPVALKCPEYSLISQENMKVFETMVYDGHQRKRDHRSSDVSSTIEWNNSSVPVEYSSNLLQRANSFDDVYSDSEEKVEKKQRKIHFSEKSIQQLQELEEQAKFLKHFLIISVVSGASRGQSFVINNIASIGNLTGDCQIKVNDACVSKRHAIIKYDDGGYWLFDCNSEWGTMQRLQEDKCHKLLQGDIFFAGKTEFTYFGKWKSTSACTIS